MALFSIELVSILKDKKQVSEKSVKDLINEHKKDIDPANKLNGNFPM